LGKELDYQSEDGIEEFLKRNMTRLGMPTKCECGGRYSYKGLGVYVCDGCGKEFLNEYAKVREFIDVYGTNYSILEISEQTGVSKKMIDLFVNEGKFAMVERTRRCINCGSPVTSGDLCDRCKLLKPTDDPTPKKQMFGYSRNNYDERGKMHYFNDKK